MRQRHEYDTRRKTEVQADESSTVSLYGDYAFIDTSANKFQLGKVTRITLAGEHGRKDYKMPVDFNHPKKKSLSVMMYRYSALSDPRGSEPANDDSSENLYLYKETGDVVKIDFTDIFSHVNLSWNGTNFSLPSDEADVILNKSHMLLRPNARPNASQSIATSPRRRTRDQHAREEEEFDGTVRVRVIPEPSTSNFRGGQHE